MFVFNKKSVFLTLISIIVFLICYSFFLYIEQGVSRVKEENKIKQGYCPRTNTILTKEELYRNAMKNFLKELIKAKNKLVIEFESIKRNPEENIWISNPLNGKALKEILTPVYQDRSYNYKKAKVFYERLKNIVDPLTVVEDISDRQLLPKNNGFNVYWNVTPPHFIYAYDCCTIYTKDEAIKRIRFLEK